MKNGLLLIWGCLAACSLGAQEWQKIHSQAIVVDTHNDFPSIAATNGYALGMDLKGRTHTDLKRLQQGGVDVQIWSIFCGGDQPQPFEWANREIDSIYAWCQRYAANMVLVKTPDQLEAAVKNKKLASMMGVEGGHMIENDLQKLKMLFDRGARYLTLTWNNSTPWASSALDETRQTPGITPGLNDFGKEVVRTMNKLGMLIDLSHVGEKTFYDVMATTTKPVLVSHSCVHTLCPVFRNLTDDQIRAIGKNGGVIHLNFYSGFIDSSFQRRTDSLNTETEKLAQAQAGGTAPTEAQKDAAKASMATAYDALRPSIDQLIDHADHIIKLIGIDHVGLGSDFDGVSSLPSGLDDVSHFPLITKRLLERGYKRKDVEKILGGNFLRLFKAVQP